MSSLFLLTVRPSAVRAWTTIPTTAVSSRLRGQRSSLTRCFVSGGSSGGGGKKKAFKNKWQRKTRGKKITLNKEVNQQQASDNLAAAFEEMARKEGFGKSSSSSDTSQVYFAKDSTFDDEFKDEDYDEFMDDDIEDEEGEAAAAEEDNSNYWGDSTLEDDNLDDDGGPVVGQAQALGSSMEARIAAARSGSSSMEKEEDDDLDDLDLGQFGYNNDDDDMDARLAAAKSDVARGRVSADPSLADITREDMKRLGFRSEANPFEGDLDTPRQEEFKLITDPLTCSACGADFQSHNMSKPGFLPTEKYEVQAKLAKLRELQELKSKAESADWSPEDEIEWLIRTTGEDAESGETTMADDIDIDAAAEEMGIDLGAELTKKKSVICKRCHGLQNFGQVEEALRPGWTDEPLMSQEKFRDLLRPLSGKPAVLIAIVDLFDFSGSVLPELDAIAGDNPVIIAANKADLLPSKMGQQRAETWVRRELEYLGVKSLANIGGAVRLVSCKTGMGVAAMLGKARKLAEEMDADVYVVGAANAGKSTLMNYILRSQDKNKDDFKHLKKRAGNENARKGALTVSPLPGTTLKFIKVDLGDGRSIYDTPGLLVPGTLTQLLTPEELKIVVPSKRVEPITFRVEAGKCVQVGGLARISVIGDSKPFMFTFFVANDIKLHPTSQSRADEFVAKHAGKMLTPPLEPGPERMEQIGEFESHIVEIEGTSWKKAAADITLTGLGWVAVTGPGTATIEVLVPKGIGVQVRPPLMPFDMWEVAAKYTGSRAVRKQGKSISGKRRGGVGRNYSTKS